MTLICGEADRDHVGIGSRVWVLGSGVAGLGSRVSGLGSKTWSLDQIGEMRLEERGVLRD
eukprot:1350209-Rhodomonas_salina.1